MTVLRVAILGQGRSGRDIHGAYLSRHPDRYRVVAAVDPLEDRRARAAAEYGCSTYPDHGPVLSRRDIDLVVNATPSKLHVPVTLELLRAGHNVLCEKPAARRATDVDAMAEAARSAGKTLAFFQQSRYAPGFVKMREVIGSGALGRVVQVAFHSSGFQRRYDWQTLTSEMAGNLLNTGPHPLDQALQLFGEDAEPEVRCWMRRATSLGDADDHVLLVLSGSDRPVVRLEISSCMPFSAPPYLVYGTLGGLQGGPERVEWKCFDPGQAPPVALTREPLRKPDGTPSYCVDALELQTSDWSAPSEPGLFDQMSHAYYTMLHGALTGQGPLEVTAAQVRRQVAVIEEAQRQNPHIWG